MRTELFQDIKVMYTWHWLDHQINQNKSSPQFPLMGASEVGMSLTLKDQSSTQVSEESAPSASGSKDSCWSLGRRGWVEGPSHSHAALPAQDPNLMRGPHGLPPRPQGGILPLSGLELWERTGSVTFPSPSALLGQEGWLFGGKTLPRLEKLRQRHTGGGK